MQNITKNIINVIQGTVTDLGFDLVTVNLRGSNPKILEILIDRLDEAKVSIDDCQMISRNISVLLDVEDIISDKYYLEVSSAGIERPLLKFQDYSKFQDRFVNIKLKELLNGQTRYHGKIVKAEDNKIYLDVKGKTVIFSFDLIKSAYLVLTDEMFRNLLNIVK